MLVLLECVELWPTVMVTTLPPVELTSVVTGVVDDEDAGGVVVVVVVVDVEEDTGGAELGEKIIDPTLI